MDKKGQERIVEVFREIAKDLARFLSTSDTLLVNSYSDESTTILAYLFEEHSHFIKFSEEYLEKLLHDKIRELIRRIRQNEPGKIQGKARDAVERLFMTWITTQPNKASTCQLPGLFSSSKKKS